MTAPVSALRFSGVAGPAGLSMKHPPQLELTIERRHADEGRDFAAELELAISEYQLRLAEAGGKQPRLSSAGDSSP